MEKEQFSDLNFTVIYKEKFIVKIIRFLNYPFKRRKGLKCIPDVPGSVLKSQLRYFMLDQMAKKDNKEKNKRQSAKIYFKLLIGRIHNAAKILLIIIKKLLLFCRSIGGKEEINMRLEPIEVEILAGVYNTYRNKGKVINYRDYRLTEEDKRQKVQEFAYHLLNLRNLGYIRFNENQVFAIGGKMNKRYKNKVLVVRNIRNIIISKTGIEILEKIREQEQNI